MSERRTDAAGMIQRRSLGVFTRKRWSVWRSEPRSQPRQELREPLETGCVSISNPEVGSYWPGGLFKSKRLFEGFASGVKRTNSCTKAALIRLRSPLRRRVT